MLFGVRLKYCLNCRRQLLQIASIISIFTLNENISIWKEGDSILLRISDCFWVCGWQNQAEKPLMIILYKAWRTRNGSCSTPKNGGLSEWEHHSGEPWGPRFPVGRPMWDPHAEPDWPMPTTVRDMWYPGLCQSPSLTRSPRDLRASSWKLSWRKSRLGSWSTHSGLSSWLELSRVCMSWERAGWSVHKGGQMWEVVGTSNRMAKGKGTEAETPPKLGEQRQQKEVKGWLEKAGTTYNQQAPGCRDASRQGEGCAERLKEDRELPLLTARLRHYEYQSELSAQHKCSVRCCNTFGSTGTV